MVKKSHRHKLWRLNVGELTGLAVFLLLAGLSHAREQQAATVRIATAGASSDAALFIADKKGYFREEGLAVTFTRFNSAAKMIAPLGTGQLDVGGGTVSAGLYNAAARGINVKVVADKGSIRPGYGFSSLLVRKDLVESGRYKSLRDLKGMKVAIGASGTGTASALNEALKQGGLKYADVDVVDIAFPQHMPAFANKAIEASITNEPTTTRCVQSGVAARIAGNDVIYPDQQTAVILFSDEFVKSRPAIARKFMKAYIRAARDYNDALKDGKLAGNGADEVIAILTQYTEIKDPDLYRKITPNALHPDGKLNIASLRKDLEFFREQGLIEGKVTVEQIIDTSFLDAALRELGPYQLKGK